MSTILMSIFDDRHFFHVATSYGLTALLLGGLVLWVFLAYQSKKKQMARLEAQSLKANK